MNECLIILLGPRSIVRYWWKPWPMFSYNKCLGLYDNVLAFLSICFFLLGFPFISVSFYIHREELQAKDLGRLADGTARFSGTSTVSWPLAAGRLAGLNTGLLSCYKLFPVNSSTVHGLNGLFFTYLDNYLFPGLHQPQSLPQAVK